jgi:hypothetical protein
LLPLFSDDVEAAVEEPQGQRLSELDEIRRSMHRLRQGMKEHDVEKVLILTSTPPIASRTLYTLTRRHVIDREHILWLTYGRYGGLINAELRNSRMQLVEGTGFPPSWK